MNSCCNIRTCMMYMRLLLLLCDQQNAFMTTACSSSLNFDRGPEVNAESYLAMMHTVTEAGRCSTSFFTEVFLTGKRPVLRAHLCILYSLINERDPTAKSCFCCNSSDVTQSPPSVQLSEKVECLLPKKRKCFLLQEGEMFLHLMPHEISK